MEDILSTFLLIFILLTPSTHSAPYSPAISASHLEDVEEISQQQRNQLAQVVQNQEQETEQLVDQQRQVIGNLLQQQQQQTLDLLNSDIEQNFGHVYDEIQEANGHIEQISQGTIQVFDNQFDNGLGIDSGFDLEPAPETDIVVDNGGYDINHSSDLLDKLDSPDTPPQDYAGPNDHVEDGTLVEGSGYSSGSENIPEENVPVDGKIDREFRPENYRDNFDFMNNIVPVVDSTNGWFQSIGDKWNKFSNAVVDTGTEIGNYVAGSYRDIKSSFESGLPKIWHQMQERVKHFGSLVQKGTQSVVERVALCFDEGKGAEILGRLERHLEEGNEVVDRFLQKVGEKISVWEKERENDHVDPGLLPSQSPDHRVDPHYTDIFKDQEILSEFSKMVDAGILTQEEMDTFTQSEVKADRESIYKEIHVPKHFL